VTPARTPTRRQALAAGAWYFAIAAAWMVLFEKLRDEWVLDPRWGHALESAGDWVLVGTTAVALAVALDRYFAASRRSGERLHESERRLLALGDNLPDSYVFQYVRDRQGIPAFTYVSAGIERVHGVSPADAMRDIGASLGTLSPEGMRVYLEAEAQSARTMSDFDCEVEYRGPSGDLRTLQVRGRPRRDADGLTHWDGIAVDITEHRRAADQLREREAQLQLFVSHSPAAIAMLDRDLRYLVVSERWGAEYKIEVRNLLGRSHYEVFPDVPERWKDVHRRCLNGSIERSDAEEFPRADGTVDWVRWECRPWYDVRGEVGGLIIFSEVVTERKRAEEAVRASEAQFRAIFEGTSIGVAQAHPTTRRLLRVNRKMREITGYSEEELLTMRIADFVHPDDRAQDDRLFARLLSGETNNARIEKRYVRKDGSIAWANANVTLLRDASGAPLSTIAAIEDITARKELEAQYQQAQKMEAIGQLAGGVAHDFNNILTSVLMQVELGHEGDLAGAREALEQIRSDGARAADLTRQLLLFSRRQVMQSRDVDVNDVVAKLARMLRRIIGEDVSLKLDLRPGALVAHADAGMLEQVLLNLSVNARDAMPGGGSLTISTERARADAALVRGRPEAREGSRYLVISVADTGDGIPPGVLPHIFEPFFTTKEAGKGTGLGLATVFGIVKQHGGFIDVDTEAGRGATFRVYLPEVSVVSFAAAEAPRPKPRGGTETILLAEDEEMVRRATRTVLARLGYTVLEASTGAEALTVWREHQRDVSLLVTDIVMPGGMTGCELAEHLLADKPGLKVIYTSGYNADTAGRELKLRAGENYVQKPIRPAELLEVVRATLDAGATMEQPVA
jgi:PAS domain S-box-containing protein